MPRKVAACDHLQIESQRARAETFAKEDRLCPTGRGAWRATTRPPPSRRILGYQRLGSDKVKGFVIDLRNNPGGLLEQAISVSDAFLDKVEIVSTRGRNAEETQRFNARPGGRHH